MRMIPKNPYKAWEVNENDFPKNKNLEDKLEFLLRYAVLAPSSHNTQPWLFKIEKKSIKILPNLERTLDYSDRTRRELFISLGCSLANVMVAAEYFALSYRVVIFPEDMFDNTAVQIKFSKRKVKTKNTKLFREITRRTTNRLPYKNKYIKDEIISEIKDLPKGNKIKAKFITDDTQIKKIAKIMYGAHKFAFSDRHFKEELQNWIRHVYSKKRDGIALFGFKIPHLLTPIASKTIKLIPSEVQAQKDKELIENTKALLVLTTPYDTRDFWIKTGRDFELIALGLSKYGISTAPMAGIIEHEPSRDKLQSLLKTDSTPVFFARVGYSPRKIHKSPRIPYTDLLLS